MTAAERPDPVVSLTDAPTAEEQHAIDAGLAHFNEEQSEVAGSALDSCGWRRTRRVGAAASPPCSTRSAFQAPGFYEKNGYRALGTVACLPPGTSRIFMTKPLA